MEEEDNTAGVGVNKTSKIGSSKFFSQILKRSTESDISIAKQATDDMWKQMWMIKEPDKDGYFSLQLGKKIDNNDMFLAAEDASSLTIARK